MLVLQGSYAPAAAQPNTSLPTPPSSPQRSLRPSRPIDSTVKLLDSLVAFYHQERMWVYRTRASLELVLEPALSSTSSSATSTLESDSPMEVDESTTLNTAAIRALGGDTVESSTAPGLRATLGMRRKKGFKLKLEGISTRAKRRETDLGHEAPPTPGVQMLEMFENMMQARMDSCERLRSLVKDANTLANDS
jgi:hypothetical protein